MGFGQDTFSNIGLKREGICGPWALFSPTGWDHHSWGSSEAGLKEIMGHFQCNHLNRTHSSLGPKEQLRVAGAEPFSLSYS